MKVPDIADVPTIICSDRENHRNILYRINLYGSDFDLAIRDNKGCTPLLKGLKDKFFFFSSSFNSKTILISEAGTNTLLVHQNQLLPCIMIQSQAGSKQLNTSEGSLKYRYTSITWHHNSTISWQ